MLLADSGPNWGMLAFIFLVMCSVYRIKKVLTRNPEIGEETAKGIVNKIERWFK